MFPLIHAFMLGGLLVAEAPDVEVIDESVKDGSRVAVVRVEDLVVARDPLSPHDDQQNIRPEVVGEVRRMPCRPLCCPLCCQTDKIAFGCKLQNSYNTEFHQAGLFYLATTFQVYEKYIILVATISSLWCTKFALALIGYLGMRELYLEVDTISEYPQRSSSCPRAHALFHP